MIQGTEGERVWKKRQERGRCGPWKQRRSRAEVKDTEKVEREHSQNE